MFFFSANVWRSSPTVWRNCKLSPHPIKKHIKHPHPPPTGGDQRFGEAAKVVLYKFYFLKKFIIIKKVRTVKYMGLKK